MCPLLDPSLARSHVSTDADTVSLMTQNSDSRDLGLVIGESVQRARRSMKTEMTQEQLAARLRAGGVNWSRNVVANLESGRMSKVGVRDLLAVAAALEMSPLDLLAPRDAGDIEVVPGGTAWPAEVVRLWVSGAADTLHTAFNGQRHGEIYEEAAVELAREAMRAGSSLAGLRALLFTDGLTQVSALRTSVERLKTVIAGEAKRAGAGPESEGLDDAAQRVAEAMGDIERSNAIIADAMTSIERHASRSRGENGDD